MIDKKYLDCTIGRVDAKGTMWYCPVCKDATYGYYDEDGITDCAWGIGHERVDIVEIWDEYYE